MIKLIQGDDKTINLKILGSVTKDPYDLTGATEITVLFPGEEEPIEKLLSTEGVEIIDAKLGKLRVTLSEDETAQLRVGENQDFEVALKIGSTDKIIQFLKSLSVKKRIFA